MPKHNPVTALKEVAKLLAERVAALRVVVRIVEPCDCGPHKAALQTAHVAVLEHLSNAICRLNEVRAHLALAHVEAGKLEDALALQHAGGKHDHHTASKGSN